MRRAVVVALCLAAACAGPVAPPPSFEAPCTTDADCQAGLFCLPTLGGALSDGGCAAARACSFYCTVTSPYDCASFQGAPACRGDGCTKGTLCAP